MEANTTYLEDQYRYDSSSDYTKNFRTRIHVAADPIGPNQLCSRCGETLIDYLNSAGVGPVWSPSWWRTGAFIGVTEMADGRKTNPVCTILMDRDAREIDELRCDERTQ
jgi:hypothetical protein